MSATEGGSRWNMIPLDGTFRVEQAGQEAGLLVIENGESSFVALEGGGKKWLGPGDLVEIEVEGIGRLVNRMKAG